MLSPRPYKEDPLCSALTYFSLCLKRILALVVSHVCAAYSYHRAQCATANRRGLLSAKSQLFRNWREKGLFLPNNWKSCTWRRAFRCLFSLLHWYARGLKGNINAPAAFFFFVYSSLWTFVKLITDITASPSFSYFCHAWMVFKGPLEFPWPFAHFLKPAQWQNCLSLITC